MKLLLILFCCLFQQFPSTEFGKRQLPKGVILMYNEYSGNYIIREDSVHYFNGKSANGGIMQGYIHSGHYEGNRLIMNPCKYEYIDIALKIKDSSQLKTIWFRIYDKNVAELNALLDRIKQSEYKPVN